MQNYLDLLQNVMEGTRTHNRTGTDSICLPNQTLTFDLSNNTLPVVTTKKIWLRAVVAELLWFISGDTNVKTLQDQGITIWDEWADSKGNLGNIYGKQWRDFNGVDQLSNIIRQCTSTPDSRRILMSAWNPSELHKMALPPCHLLYQINVLDNKLHANFYMRSTDVFLGLPFNITSYALLTHLIGHVTNLEPASLTFFGSNVHLYTNHVDQAKTQIDRIPYTPPKVVLNPDVTNIFDFKYKDIEIKDYVCWAKLDGQVAV